MTQMMLAMKKKITWMILSVNYIYYNVDDAEGEIDNDAVDAEKKIKT